MRRSGDDPEAVIRIRPHGHLFRQSTVALLLLLTPIFAVILWLTIPNGTWLPVVVALLVVMLLFGLAMIAFYRTSIWVGRSRIAERGFFGRMTSIPADSIDSIMLLELYESGTLDTHPQLFVSGTDGHVLLRMRGQYWSREDMESVAEHLEVPIVHVPDPLTLRELGESRPELLYWFERRFPRRSLDR
ncbi:hypothetical protein GCM10022381_37590 [Leifsonia kafniensis]|uniref:Uncharacterized protein n=1 Tax=Leifsonia kafniensis TaxID=475957 RepID=A0ABP7L3D3_9MICO